jgi:hypothetical protein
MFKKLTGAGPSVRGLGADLRVDSSASRYGLLVGSCEHRNEPFGSINGEEFHDQMSDYYFLEDWTQNIFIPKHSGFQRVGVHPLGDRQLFGPVRYSGKVIYIVILN